MSTSDKADLSDMYMDLYTADKCGKEQGRLVLYVYIMSYCHIYIYDIQVIQAI